MSSVLNRRPSVIVALSLCLLSTQVQGRTDEETYLYADLWTDADETEAEGFNFYGTASVELGNCCPGCPDVAVEDDILHDGNTSMDYASASGICTATVYTGFYFTEFSPDGDFSSRGRTPPSNCMETDVQKVRTWAAVFQYSHHNVLTDKHEWSKNSAVCNGVCQPARRCTATHQLGTNWLWVLGWSIGIGPGRICRPRPEVQLVNQPQCIQEWGINVMGDNCPSSSPTQKPH